MIFPKSAAAVAAMILLATPGPGFAATSVISNPTNTYSFSSLSGDLQGGQQTQFVGETFTSPVNGALTDFQFNLNSSNLALVYGAVYSWDGEKPGAKLWQSDNVAGAAGLLDFAPAGGVQVSYGQSYVAFLSTYQIAGNSGLATVGACLNFVGCGANSVPRLGTLVWSNILQDTVPLPTPGQTGTPWNAAGNDFADLTFSASFAGAAPEPSTWAMMLIGLAGLGAAAHRRRFAARTA